jgi:hypothetical protein
MAVSSYYQSLRNPDFNALATFMDGWVGARAKMNAQVRAAEGGGEDPDQLIKLEQVLADKLGRLQEAKTQGDTAKMVQLTKGDYDLKVEALKGENAVNVKNIEARMKAAELRADQASDRRDAARKEQIAQQEVRDEIGAFITKAVRDNISNQSGQSAQDAVDMAIQGGLSKIGAEGVSIGDARRDEAAYVAWQAAGGGSPTPSSLANYIAGKYFPRGEDPAAYRARTHGGYTSQESRTEDAYLTRGMGGGYGTPHAQAAWDYEGPVQLRTEKGTTTKTSGGGGPEGGEGTVRTRAVVGDGDRTIDMTMERAQAGDPEATAALNEMVDSAIAEQRQMLADLRKRREAALAARTKGGLPTANWMIDNPNRYTGTPVIPTMTEAVKIETSKPPPSLAGTVRNLPEPDEADRGGSQRDAFLKTGAKDYLVGGGSNLIDRAAMRTTGVSAQYAPDAVASKREAIKQWAVTTHKGESLDDAANQAKIAEKQQKIEAMTPEQVETFYTKIQGVP